MGGCLFLFFSQLQKREINEINREIRKKREINAICFGRNVMGVL